MSGRIGRPDITEYISRQIADRLDVSDADTVVDVGCGDGSFLAMAFERGVLSSHLYGILPTEEEVGRVASRLSTEYGVAAGRVVMQGLADSIALANETATKLVCNGVFLLLPNREAFESSLAELWRVTRPGGKVLIGEIPEVDEAAIAGTATETQKPRNAAHRAYRVFKVFGIREVLARLTRRLALIFGRERIVVVPSTSTTWLPPEEFEGIAGKLGFSIVDRYRSPLLDELKNPMASSTRWNFILEKR